MVSEYRMKEIDYNISQPMDLYRQVLTYCIVKIEAPTGRKKFLRAEKTDWQNDDNSFLVGFLSDMHDFKISQKPHLFSKSVL